MSGLRLLDDAVHERLVNPAGERRDLFHFLDEPGGPEAFLVRVPPHNTVTTHFHRVDQFQVFHPSPGARYQRHGYAGVLVHYTDAYSVYGPISTADEPLDFFTLRAVGDSFTGYMPGAREHLVRRGERNLHGEVPLDVPFGRDIATADLFDAFDDGLRAAVWRVPGGATFTGPSARGSAGQYWTVLDGADIASGRSAAAPSLQWVGRSDPPAAFVAGSDGPTVLLVQFPWPGSAPAG